MKYIGCVLWHQFLCKATFCFFACDRPSSFDCVSFLASLLFPGCINKENKNVSGESVSSEMTFWCNWHVQVPASVSGVNFNPVYKEIEIHLIVLFNSLVSEKDKSLLDDLAVELDKTAHRVVKDWEYLANSPEINAPLYVWLRCRIKLRGVALCCCLTCWEQNLRKRHWEIW